MAVSSRSGPNIVAASSPKCDLLYVGIYRSYTGGRPRHQPSLAYETLHIIFTSQKSWFSDNDIDRCGALGRRTSKRVANCPSDVPCLRCSFYFFWDHYYFSIVPKQQTIACVYSLLDEDVPPATSMRDSAVYLIPVCCAWYSLPR